MVDNHATLPEAARCYDSCIPPGRQLSVIIYQLAQLILRQNRSFDVTPSALLNAATCYDSCIPPGRMLSVISYQLDQLTGGSGPGDPVETWMGPGAPDIPGGDDIILYYDTDTWNQYWWDPVTNNWYIINPEVPMGVYWKDTLGDLQLVPTVSTNRRAITCGYLVKGDGMGRFYYWDPDSTDSQLDGGGNQRLDVVKPDDIADTDPGRWIEWTG